MPKILINGKEIDFEKGMTHHNKAHTGLGAVNTFSIVNGPNAGKYVRVAAAQWPTPPITDRASRAPGSGACRRGRALLAAGSSKTKDDGQDIVHASRVAR